MQDYHQLLFKGTKPIVKKGAPPKIVVKLEKRMGNKKVRFPGIADAHAVLYKILHTGIKSQITRNLLYIDASLN